MDKVFPELSAAVVVPAAGSRDLDRPLRCKSDSARIFCASLLGSGGVRVLPVEPARQCACASATTCPQCDAQRRRALDVMLRDARDAVPRDSNHTLDVIPEPRAGASYCPSPVSFLLILSPTPSFFRRNKRLKKRVLRDANLDKLASF